jgi:hypothetical protein
MASNTNSRKETAEDQHSTSGAACKFGKDCKFIPDKEHAFVECKPLREIANNTQCKYGADCRVLPGKLHAFSACKKIREKTFLHFDNPEKYCEHCDQSVHDHPADQKILMLCKPRGDHTSAGCRGCWCPKAPSEPSRKDSNHKAEVVYCGKPVYKDATSKKHGCGCAPEERMSEVDAIDYIKERTENELTNSGHPVIVGKKIKNETFPSLPTHTPVDDDEDDAKTTKTAKPGKPVKSPKNIKKNFAVALQSPAPAAAAVAAASGADESVIATKKESATPNAQVSFADQVVKTTATTTVESFASHVISTDISSAPEEPIPNTPRGSERSDTIDTEIHMTPGAFVLLLQYTKANGKILQGKLVDRNGELVFI